METNNRSIEKLERDKSNYMGLIQNRNSMENSAMKESQLVNSHRLRQQEKKEYMEKITNPRPSEKRHVFEQYYKESQ